MFLSSGHDDARRLTPAFVRRRLEAHDRDASAAPRPELILAAVLVPLVIRADGLTALFTRRTEHLTDHAGQISFPGGRVEPQDRDPVATALREADEEVGLGAEQIDVVGCLDVMDTSTGFLVTPVVGFVAPPLDLSIDANEVADTFEAPLSYLLDPANRRQEVRRRGGRTREVYVVDYRDHAIWGATARIVVNLHEILGWP